MKTQVRSKFCGNTTIDNLDEIKKAEWAGIWVGPPQVPSDRVGLHRVQPGEIGVWRFQYSADGGIWRNGYPEHGWPLKFRLEREDLS